jgi:hypothetical protein
MKDKINITLTENEIRLILNSLYSCQSKIVKSVEWSFLPTTIERKEKEINHYKIVINKLCRYIGKHISKRFASSWQEDCIGKIVDPDNTKLLNEKEQTGLPGTGQSEIQS